MGIMSPETSRKSISTRWNKNGTTLPNTQKMSQATSREISGLTSDGMTVRVLPGPSSLTEFEAARLAARLRAIDAGVAAVEASYLYLLLLRKDSEREIDHQRLAELLGAGVERAAGQRVWIAPRVGTQSPWSSKANRHSAQYGLCGNRAHRARACGAHRFFRRNRSSRARRCVARPHDGECVFSSSDELAGAVCAARAEGARAYRCAGHGAAAIAAADRELGLSLAPDEIEYLVTEFTRLKRNPTNVELYMFRAGQQRTLPPTKSSMQAGQSTG